MNDDNPLMILFGIAAGIVMLAIPVLWGAVFTYGLWKIGYWIFN